jgi:uncharacterized protein YacL
MVQFLQTILLVFIAWFLVSQKNEHFARIFGKQRKIILDSCALIDGRVVQIVGSGFVADELIIPQFIINELQMLADGNDSHKRERARFGLDIANQLQDSAPVKVTIDRSVFANAPAIDDRLVLLAKKLRAQLYTTDYNLGKVAAVEGVKVLNVNELAQNLRPITLPGESLKIKIIQKGSNRDQGVGYLEDGTMIVVDGAARFVSKVVPVTVTRMHQTVAGKMVFGQVQAREMAQETANNRQDDRDRQASPSNDDQRHHQHPNNNSRHAQSDQQYTQSRQGKLHSRLQNAVKRRRPTAEG